LATDARISTALPSHPKTKKLVRLLGAEAGWSLVVLILWAAANRSDGDLSGMSDEDIELAADWDGAEGQFIAALRRIRFVDGEEGEASIHDWTEHQPWAAGSEARSLKAKWNAVKRFHGEAEADRQVPEYAAIRQANSKPDAQGQDAASKDAASQQHASSTAPACSVSSPSPLRLLSESSPIPSPTVAPTPPPAPRKRSATAPVQLISIEVMVGEGVDPAHARDWLKARGKHPLTPTAWDLLKDEADKAGITPARAVEICAAKSWRGFDATWDWPGKRAAAPPGAAAPNRQEALELRNRAAASEWAERKQREMEDADAPQ
jgi:hypothetical protein